MGPVILALVATLCQVAHGADIAAKARAVPRPPPELAEVDWGTVELVPACRADVVEAVAAVAAFAHCSNLHLMRLVDRSFAGNERTILWPTLEEAVPEGLEPLWLWHEGETTDRTTLEHRLLSPHGRAILETRCELPVARWVPSIRHRRVEGYVPGPVVVLGDQRYLVSFAYVYVPGLPVDGEYDGRGTDWYYVEARPAQWWVLATVGEGRGWFHSDRSHRLDTSASGP